MEQELLLTSLLAPLPWGVLLRLERTLLQEATWEESEAYVVSTIEPRRLKYTLIILMEENS